MAKVMGKNQTLLSVIVPFYDAEQHIPICLKTLNDQTLDKDNFEVIFIDDASSDQGLSVLKEQRANYSYNIKIVSQAQNTGPGGARNLGLKKAKGTFVFFLDVDDQLESQTFELLINCAMKYNSDFCFADTNWNANGKNLRAGQFSHKKSGNLTREEVSRSLTQRIRNPNRKNDLVGAKAKIIKLDFIKSKKLTFLQNIRYLEDELFSWACLGHCSSVSYLRKQLYIYNEAMSPSTVSTSLMNNFTLTYFDEIFNTIYNCFVNRNFPKEQSETEATQGTGYFIFNILISLSKSIILKKLDKSSGRAKLLLLNKQISKSLHLHNIIKKYKLGDDEDPFISFFLRWRLAQLATIFCLRRARKIVLLR